MAQLSSQADAICERYYGSWQAKANGCHRCPIQKACHSGHEWSQAGLDAWRDRVNDAAAHEGMR